MIIKKVGLGDVATIEIEKRSDDRGFFARTFCREELAAAGIEFEIAQCNLSRNERRYTLRGLHWQAPPHEEDKIVSCHRGAIFDVAVDVRPGSPTHLRWYGCELTQRNYRMLYIPKGFAHGYLTLSDDAEVAYLVSAPFAPEAGRGCRWNDPAVGICWPVERALLEREMTLSPKDAKWDYLDRSLT